MYGRILAMTLVPWSRAVRSEAVRHHVDIEVVDLKFIGENIPRLLSGRHIAVLAVSPVHPGGRGGVGDGGCVCAAAAGQHSPVSNPP